MSVGRIEGKRRISFPVTPLDEDALDLYISLTLGLGS